MNTINSRTNKTKERILEVATELFLTNGYINTTSRMISKEANVNLGLIPYYFEKKENIARCVYSKYATQFFNQINQSDFNIENSIQHLMITYLMVQYNMNQLPGMMNFYLELIKEDIMLYSIEDYSLRSLELVDQEFNLSLTSKNIALALSIIKGTERSFTLGSISGNIDMTLYEMNIEIIRCSLLYLGVDLEILDANADIVRKKILDANLEMKHFNEFF